MGKGFGSSASGFAALDASACASLDLDIDYVSLSELVRMDARSATSLVGSFSLWCADKNGRSCVEQIVEPDAVDLGMVIVLICCSIQTDEARGEVLSSRLD